MDKQVVFKTSAFGGFEKKAVLDYIYRLNEESSTMHTQLREQINSLTAARASLDENLRQTNERLLTAQRETEGMKADLSKERARAIELGGVNDEMKNEAARHREQAAQLRRELEEAREEAEALRTENGRLHEKQAEVDHAVASVGKLLLDARKDADLLIAEAKREAAEIKSAAEGEAARIHAEAEEYARTLREQAETEVVALRREACEQAEAQRAEAQRESEDMIEDARHKADLLRIESDLAVEEAGGRFAVFLHEAGGIRSAISELIGSYQEKADALAQQIKTSERAYQRTLQTIKSADYAPDHNEEAPAAEANRAPDPEPTIEAPSEAADIAEVFFR